MKTVKSSTASTTNHERERRARAAIAAALFCGFALYIAWHASHESQTRPVDELPMSTARGDDTSTLIADADKPELIKRGAYLARIGDCAACHTADPGRPYAGGLPISTPFGKIYTPNITPDPDTGIGRWSDTDFMRALHEGIGKGGERLYPAFPYVEFTRVTGQDVLAIRAYLSTVAPVHYRPPTNELRFPFNQRWLMILWNLFNFNEGRFVPDPKQSAEFNRGAYLVEGLAHCEACHTPRNFMQGLKTTGRFSGATQAGWQACNITPDRMSGIGNRGDDALISSLSTGIAASHASAAGPVADVVQHSTQYLTHEDLRSIVAYLRALPPVSGGVRRQTKDSDVLMPAFGDELNTEQVAAISSYVINQLGNPQTSITAAQVAALRAQPR